MADAVDPLFLEPAAGVLKIDEAGPRRVRLEIGEIGDGRDVLVAVGVAIPGDRAIGAIEMPEHFLPK